MVRLAGKEFCQNISCSPFRWFFFFVLPSPSSIASILLLAVGEEKIEFSPREPMRQISISFDTFCLGSW